MDQLLFDHARSLEIDIHKDTRHAGQWNIYHTSKTSNAFCSPLSECLKQLRQFHYAVPQHEAVTIMIELKEVLAQNFDSSHTPADLDSILENAMGDVLYRPRDFLSRCGASGSNPTAVTMRECAQMIGWPRVKDLRGKFIFVVLGNWRWKFIGHGGQGWADYAADVHARSAFPMISDWETGEPIDPVQYQRAKDASVFIQAEDYSNPEYLKHLKEEMKAGMMIRMDNAFSLAQQQDQVLQGFQYLQTDYPWIQHLERGPAQALKGLKGETLLEPGHRILLEKLDRSSTDAGEALLNDYSARSDWEAFVSSTRESPKADFLNPRAVRGKGCLVARTLETDAVNLESIRVCREVMRSRPLRFRKPLAEDAQISIHVLRKNSEPFTVSYFSGSNFSNGVGDQIRLSVDTSNGRSCVTAYSASEINLSKTTPVWTALHRECFLSTLPVQGLSAEKGDVLFVGAQHQRDGVKEFVRSADLRLPAASSGYSLSDLSVVE